MAAFKAKFKSNSPNSSETSAKEMKGIILQALQRCSETLRDGILDAISDPIVSQEYAARLVDSSGEEMIDFYCNRLGQLPDQIKEAVSLQICADANLYRKHVQYILSGSYRRLFNWFQDAARYFPDSFPLQFDLLIPGYLDSLRRTFRVEKLILLEDLASLILHFRKSGCRYAAQKFLEVCLENDYAVFVLH